MIRAATFSRCGQHRTSLTRRWDESKHFILWIGLNPSQAGAEKDDPTVRRIIRFTESLGYGGFWLLNPISLIATDPEKLRGITFANLIDNPTNEGLLLDILPKVKLTIACWGATAPELRPYADRWANTIAAAGEDLYCLGTTKDGSPRHPLYLKKTTQLTLWRKRS